MPKYIEDHMGASICMVILANVIFAFGIASHSAASSQDTPVPVSIVTPLPEATLPTYLTDDLGWWTGWQRSADKSVAYYCSLQQEYLRQPNDQLAGEMQAVDRQYRTEQLQLQEILEHHGSYDVSIRMDSLDLLDSLARTDFALRVTDTCGTYAGDFSWLLPTPANWKWPTYQQANQVATPSS